ncbi:Cys-tRNA(Pro)/Cys-tRNA(Cys) deacylase [Ureibacillus xyleni]|uniref:Cys-tRNA(Pro)/Cys-tRNA(Cys) deacylase n=1 Tax=Ureibacillus xyleni TaxID=614648 RepID=A0A285ST03_9BACL|nr:Cys-tRNA(Pro) deacylase [Ureibacillus xyleni]SOC11603.1 Cys-tRNA(Pro)/Cys-tRNA(Cys) deacylase [Ureibacillus xyleni]
MSKNKIQKTNAVRLLDQQKVEYDIIEYIIEDNQLDGVSVASKVGHPVSHVFKTLVATAGKGKVYVFVIPVAEELNLKTCAKLAGEKKIEMLHVKELLATTGYIRGGCSPVGMKKQYPTFIDNSAESLEYILVSAGKIGMQMKLKPIDLVKITRGTFAKLTN